MSWSWKIPRQRALHQIHKQQSLIAAGSCANSWSEEFASFQSQKNPIFNAEAGGGAFI